MFETAELGHTIDKQEYDELEPQLRLALLTMQEKLKQADFPVLILINGVDGAGKGDTLNLLHEWMDARYLKTFAIAPPTEEERQRPSFWRYWMALPPRGRTGIFLGAWYTDPIVTCAYTKDQKKAEAELDAAMRRISTFERELVDDGAVVIKFWMHISKKQQHERLRKLEKDPETAWRVTDKDWEHHKRYDRFRPICERALRMTSTGEAPWIVVEGTDTRYRDITVAQRIIERVSSRLDAMQPRPEIKPPEPVMPRPLTILDSLDLSQSMEKEDYEKELKRWQARLNALSREAQAKEVGAIALFEGWDAAGKGGAIRRITRALDARYYQVIPISAPTDEEKAHHYLWRFWRHLPRLGQLTIYDRSWYGRVLVERVEGFATQNEWMRAYHEINDFEEQLCQHGIVLAKYWLNISNEEQLRRFKEREEKPWKRYKITEEDYRNRDKWDNYLDAAHDMVGRTSTEYAPWVLVEAEDKRHARIKIIKDLCKRLEAAL